MMNDVLLTEIKKIIYGAIDKGLHRYELGAGGVGYKMKI